MPLYDTGQRVKTDSGVNARSLDQAENVVVVSTSHEAIEDFGWQAIWTAASKKYDAGDYDRSKTPPFIRIQTSDCKGG